MSSSIAYILAFVLYLGFMVYLGFRNAGNNRSASDFFIGGRRVGPWMTALSAEASDMSGWLLMGLPGLAYLGGIKEAFWTALGLILGTYLNWLFVAKPLRKCTIAFGDSITIPEFFTNRFNDSKRLISSIAVIFIILFFTIYTASGFVACAKLFNSVFGLNYYVGLAIGIVVILSYTILGGYLAVCSTDFIQGTLMFIALIIISVGAILALGGTHQAMEKVNLFGQKAMNGEFNEAMQAAFTGNQTYSGMSIVSAMAWGLGYFGMPHILTRFMGIRSNKDVKLSRRIATVWVIVAFAGAVWAGTVGTAYLFDKVNGGFLSSAETVVSESVKYMFPSFIAGIFLCAILAAAMSTADSQLLVASSAFSQDIYKGLIKKDADHGEVLRVSRIAVLAIALIAMFLALDENSSIFGLVSYAWAGFGGTFGPLILLALFWRRTTRLGATCGLICGGLTVVIWHNLHGGLFDVYEILPAFIICLLVTVVVSLLDKRKDDLMLANFDAYRKMED